MSNTGDPPPDGSITFVSDQLLRSGGHVALGAERDPAGVCFFVRDTGTGIPADNPTHMFDRERQQRHHTSSGAGPGLAIVRGIVEAHSGHVDVSSALGTGSRFSFTIPVP